MRKICLLLLGACFVLPAYAQDAASAYTDAATAADNSGTMTPQGSSDSTAAAPADAGTAPDTSTSPAADAAPASAATPEASSAPASADAAPADSGSAETAPAPAAADTSAPADAGAAPDQSTTSPASPAADASAPAATGNPYADAGSPAASTPIAGGDTGAAAPAAAESAPAAAGGGNPYADAGSPAATSGGNPYADAGSPAATSGGNPYADAGSPAATSGSIGGESEAAGAGSSGSSSESEAPPSNPIKLYVGYDRTHINFQISGLPQGPVAGPTPPATTPQSPLQQQFGSSNLSSNFNQIRAGVRVFDTVGIEAHYGRKGSSGDEAGTVAVKGYEGIYVVPTATVLNTVEVAAVLGYNWLQLERPGAKANLDGVAYGVNMELPLRVLWEKLPNIRLGGGVMVYQHGSASRVYGTHFGARYDFSL
ncbi:MAG TPA: hypothetical protein VN046_05075 [Stenotrophobium sp.]|jgi:hypothetical protein|nr:hypothetical protein [Stenotrophobium sp.]